MIELIPKTWPLKLEAGEVGAVAVPGSLNIKTRLLLESATKSFPLTPKTAPGPLRLFAEVP